MYNDYDSSFLKEKKTIVRFLKYHGKFRTSIIHKNVIKLLFQIDTI